MKDEVSIFIIGDSTAANKTFDKRPESGWGEYLSQHFDDQYLIKNYAVNGRSTKSFRDEGLFEQVEAELRAGDYLIIQFGHNDQKIENPARYTDPFGAYQNNITYFVEAAKKKGSIPIVLTSISRRDFVEGQLNTETIGQYPVAALEIAERLGVQSFDIFKKTQSLLLLEGESKSKRLFLQLQPGEHPNYPEGIRDNTHLNVNGAVKVAKLIAEEIKTII